MRDYGKVYTAFWTSEDARALSEDGRTLALYLLTCPHGNMIGCFRLTNAYAADDLSWDVERVSKGFAELSAKGYAYRCNRSFWVVINRYLKWNQFENPNVGKAAGKLFETITPPYEVKALLVKALREFSPTFPSSILDKFESLPKPFQNPSALSPETVVGAGAVAVVGTGTTAVTGYADASADVPPKKNQRAESKTAAVWEKYSNAYYAAYGVDPVRNVKVNSQLAQLVDRIGEGEAPFVAEFYVTHKNSYYVRKMHSVDSLLADCEKLRTEWATNTKMTQTKAMQADKTQTNLDAFAPLIAAAKAKEEAERNANAN